MHRLICQLTLVALAIASLAMPAAASAIATPEEISSSINKGLTYLKGIQSTEDGSISEWTLTAFPAVNVAPADVNKAGKAGKDARSWYEGFLGSPSWPGELATDFARGTLTAYGAGIDPARVSKRQNVIAKLLSTYQPESPGHYGFPLNGTIFGLLALSNAKTTAGAQRIPQALLDQSIEVLKANQHTDGGWTWQRVEGEKEAEELPSETDMTGAGMAALCSAGVLSTDESIEDARKFLVSKFIKASGAFESLFSGVTTTSTAWAVDGLRACGIDPQGTELQGSPPKKATPLNFLISQQVSGGGYRHSTSGSTPNVSASLDAVRALGKGNFTATPPTPSGGPQWTGATEFATGGSETTSLGLIVNDGESPLKVCAVTLAPGTTTTNLATVLNAAVAATTPAECVTGFLPGAGEGAITQVNGYPAVPAAAWNVLIDGGGEVQATRATQIGVGDTIYLKAE